MKLESNNVTVIASDASKEAVSFDIEDIGHIINMLRSNIYSNPIGSICREITCNARDAHREIDIEHIPIEITLPNEIDDNLIIRDFGPGISPYRIDRVYRKYGSSTKRDSNKQVGAMGIGAKSPFAYTNQFCVESISKIDSEEEYNNKPSAAWDKSVAEHIGKSYSEVSDKNLRCIYMMQISADNKGVIQLVSVAVTDDKTGVAVYIGIKPQDRKRFKDEIIHSTQYWSVLPIVNSEDFEYPKPVTPLAKGDNWEVFSNRNYENKHNIILDGICYPISTNEITSVSRNFLSRIKVNLYFNTGDLRVTSNRENIYYERDSDTVEVLNSRMKTVFEQLIEKFKENINDQPTFRKAFELYTQTLCIASFKADWNGKQLPPGSVTIPTEINNIRIAHYGGYQNKVNNLTSIPFDQRIIINDIGKIVPSECLNKIRSGSSNKSFVIITAKSGDTKHMLQVIDDAFEKSVGFKLDTLEPEMLSSFYSNTKRTYVKKSVNGFKLTRSKSYNIKWEITTLDLKNGSGLYIEMSDDNKDVYFVNETTNIYGKIKNLYGSYCMNGNAIFAFKSKQIKELGSGWIPLQDHLKTYLTTLLKGLTYDKVMEYMDIGHYISKQTFMLDFIIENNELNNLFKDVYKEHSLLTSYDLNFDYIVTIGRTLNMSYTPIDVESTQIVRLLKEIKDKYPIIEIARLAVQSQYSANVKPHVVDYIKMSDELNSLTEKEILKAS